jgi:SprB repeat
MKLNFTLKTWALVILTGLFSSYVHAQVCNLAITTSTQESKCKATGSITVNASNGSGNYNYTIIGTGYNSTTSTNIIEGLQAGAYTVKVKDIVTGCTIQEDNVIVDGTYQDPRFQLEGTNVSCANANNGTIKVTNLQFGKAPFTYSIVAPSATGVGSSNATGVFTDLIAGNYSIQLTDSCGGLQTRLLTLSNYSWSITGTAVSKIGCDSADVTLTVTDNVGNANASGTAFTGFLYGYIRGVGDTLWTTNRSFRFYKGTARSASFAVKDPCGNIIVSIWFDNAKPSIGSNISISNKQCNSFTATVSGKQNLTNPQFCLYDASNALITCNTNGSFPNLPYGSYCIKVTDNCYDTTINRCFTVIQPLPSISGINISNRGCAGLTVTVNTGNITNGQYCIYDVNGVVVMCNTTGVFNNLPYGTYCAHVQNDPTCFDTLIVNCFTVVKPVPAVNNTVSITRACNDFTAKITGQTNLSNPNFCLYDATTNTLINCNTTGQFSNLPYGSYCIHMQNDPACYDTIITRCFTVSPVPVSIGINANPSCTIGTTDVKITLTNGIAPYIIHIYNPQGVLVSTINTSSSTTNINGFPGLPNGASYKIVVAGACSSLDSTTFKPKISSLTKTINANSKCPSGLWQNGSGDLLVNAVFSEGKVTPKIISENGASVNISYTSKSSSTFTFSNMAPAVYVIRYTLENCSNYVYDTFTLKPYVFPTLNESSAYQCNNYSFNVNSAAKGGLTPYAYEIIGSVPASPSIIQGPKSSPLFNINNGTTYSVVRLRVTDVCGNATINDASILPLGNTIVTASSNCYYNDIALTVDSIPNSTYNWYKKISSTDSIWMGANQTYTIPNLLPADTGTYVSVVSVNGGCLTKIANFHVTGICGAGVLAGNDIFFNGYLENDNVQLRWTTAKGYAADKFVIERSEDGRNFTSIGTVNVSGNNNLGASQYLFSDMNMPAGKFYYRIVVIKQNGAPAYTKVIELSKIGGISISVMPNPVMDAFTLKFNGVKAGPYLVAIVNAEGKTIINNNYNIKSTDYRTIQRPAGTAAGAYYLLIRNLATNENETIKLLFK